MPSLRSAWPYLVLLLAAACGSSARAESIVVPAGGTLNLAADVVLTGTDALEINGTAAQPCLLQGNSFQVRTSGTWTGHVRITHCVIRALGTNPLGPSGPRRAARFLSYRLSQSPRAAETVGHYAFLLQAQGSAAITFESCTFDDSSAVYINNAGPSTTVFRKNTVLTNSRVPAGQPASETYPVIFVEGGGSGAKFFQGNRIFKSFLTLNVANNWTVGGDTDEDANIFIGLRAGIYCMVNLGPMVIRGNYIYHIVPGPTSNQTHTLNLVASNGVVVEHNFFRSSGFGLRGGGASEIRHNIFAEAGGADWIIGPRAGTRIHHNIFTQITPYPAFLMHGIAHIYGDPSIQIFNNTFDGMFHFPQSPIEITNGATVESLRNNLFFNFPHTPGYATVQPGAFGFPDAGPKARLGYADYNAFFNSGGAIDNYGVTVGGKTERLDAGFGLNDLTLGGPVDQQVDPRLQGPLLSTYPFNDEDIKAGTVSLSQVLAWYRTVYAPRADSPLVDAGDPADGAGTNIGAVESGTYPASGDTTAPPAPTGVVGTDIGGGARLFWSARGTLDTAGFRCYGSTSPSGPFAPANATIDLTAVPASGTIRGLAQGTYYFYTTAFDIAGNESLPSSIVSVTVTAPRYDISGTVRSGGTPLGGVIVSAGGNTATTSSSGVYKITGLLAGSYDVSAALAEYTFDGPKPVTLGPDATGVDFTATALTYTVSGKVSAGGTGVAGVGVNAGSSSTVTDSAGNYTLTGLVKGSYNVTASAPEYTFTATPVSVGPSKTGVDVSGTRKTYTLAGKVFLTTGPQAPIRINCGGEDYASPTMGFFQADAFFSTGDIYDYAVAVSGTSDPALYNTVRYGNNFSYNLPAVNGDYTLKLHFMEGFWTIPSQRIFNVLINGAAVLTNFDIVPAAGGGKIVLVKSFPVTATTGTVTVTFQGVVGAPIISAIELIPVGPEPEPLAGVTVTAGGQSATTAADGSYQITGLISGTYTVTASKTDMAFTPESRSVTVGPSKAAVDFTGRAAYQIRGKVMKGRKPAKGAKVTTGAQTVITAADGTYSFTRLAGGTYQVVAYAGKKAPKKPKASAKRTVIVPPSVLNVDFKL